MDLKAVTFDLDGTLYPEYRIIFPSLHVFARHARLIYYYSRVRREIRSINPIVDYRSKQAELVASYLGQAVAPVAHLIERVIYGEWLDAIGAMRPYRGLREIIARLRASGFRTGVLSDLPLARKLIYLGMEDLWDFASTSEEDGYLKPHPASFERMLNALGVTPHETIYIGNNYEYDVVGAHRLGMKTGFFSSRSVRGSKADFTFPRYSHMRDFLESLLACS
ncbi:MAG: HAD family hydrolase [Spirochaetales bacterium]|nr:HAD family hydrolase [Spirochaetales bacterium]